jgi:hypothetical protein
MEYFCIIFNYILCWSYLFVFISEKLEVYGESKVLTIQKLGVQWPGNIAISEQYGKDKDKKPWKAPGEANFAIFREQVGAAGPLWEKPLFDQPVIRCADSFVVIL